MNNSFSVITKYIPATNSRGMRIKASAEYGDKKFSIIISYPDAQSQQEAYKIAAEKCIEKVLEFANDKDSNVVLSLPIFASSYTQNGYIFFASYEPQYKG